MNLTNMEPRARDTGHRVDTAAAVDPRGAVGQGRTCLGDTVGGGACSLRGAWGRGEDGEQQWLRILLVF